MEMTGKIVGSIKVHTRTYKVREVVSLSDEAFGEVRYEKPEIRISTTENNTKKQYINTLYHELLHAFRHEMKRYRMRGEEARAGAFGDLMGENKAILDAIVKRRWK